MDLFGYLSLKAEARLTSVIRGFGINTAARLSSLSANQLLTWDKTGFFCPALANEDRSLTHSRIYSFKDVLALKVLSKLKNEYHVSTQHLKKAKDWLGLLDDNEWSERELYVDKFRRRVAIPGDTEAGRDAETGQKLFAFALGPVRDELIKEIEADNRRSNDEVGHFAKAKGHVNSLETLAGTRIPVSSVLSFIEAGFSDKEILSQYPSLKLKDISAVRILMQKKPA